MWGARRGLSSRVPDRMESREQAAGLVRSARHAAVRCVTIRLLFATTRGVALLLGACTLLNLLSELRHPGFEANLWWIDLRFANAGIGRVLLGATGLGLVMFAVRPTCSPWRGWGLRVALGLLMIVAALNAWTFWRLVASGEIRSGFPLPLSGAMLLVLASLFWGVGPRAQSRPSRGLDHTGLDHTACLLAVVASAVLFPLAQMYCFGRTDYRRPADVIVVFGCLVHADGTPSIALADRVRTGVELHRAGLAKRLLFSGGPGRGATHETDAMRTLAIQLGVPSSDIEVDLEGLNTQQTVSNAVRRNWNGHPPRVLAVSHFYHLPRIKLCFRRAGWDVMTVPADESRGLVHLPYYLLREVVALWCYYLCAV